MKTSQSARSFQVINLFFQNDKLTKLRKKYDPNYNSNIKNHLTLVYPFSGVDQFSLNEHIKKVLSNSASFTIFLGGLQSSVKGYYLYLLVSEGNSKIMSLHKNLNSGLLKNVKNKYMPKYIPHISLGCFKTKEQLDHTLIKLRRLNIHLSQKIDSIQLLTIGKDNKILANKTFSLGGDSKTISFYEKCYAVLRKVPKGKVTTYREIARALNSKAYQAVGSAMHNNPYSPQVPCHRVVNTNGDLGGFAGGSRAKVKMLKEEGVEVKDNKIVDFEKRLFKFK